MLQGDREGGFQAGGWAAAWEIKGRRLPKCGKRAVSAKGCTQDSQTHLSWQEVKRV